MQKEIKDLVLSGIHILLVEDNEWTVEMAEPLLESAGATVTHAANGRLAVELFERSAPDTFHVVLMDIFMPEMNGYEATKAIRAMNRPDAKTIPIIALTVSTFPEDIQKCYDSGMNEHIGKPLNLNTIAEKIAKQRKSLFTSEPNCV